MADNPIMKTLTIDGVTYEIYDEQARTQIGDLSKLNTTSKTDLVTAINEAAQTGGNSGGNVDQPTEYFLLKSPNGTVYKVTVTDEGILKVVGQASEDEVPEDLIDGRLLLWSDEFDGDTLNADIWGYELGYARNNEAQFYTNEAKNIYVSDSILHIVALKDNPSEGYEWSSASIDSQWKTNGVLGEQRDTGFSYGYGLIEAKARCLTPSSGVWPAFWSRGASQQSEGWPMCGEIDIGELFYNGADATHRYNPGIFWYDWHYLAQKSQTATTDGLVGSHSVYKAVDTDWHIYGMERSATEMIFYFDREEFCRIDLTALDDSDIQSAMGQPMSVKLNLAMGSTGGTIPDDLERAEYDIEYVRYYAPVNVTESTDSGTWDFPDYMPKELAPSKIARIIPERDMTNGKNQYLYWESSNEAIATATAGLIRTKSGASGDVTVTMHDTFGNTKSATITVKEGANCVSDEVREIPTNPDIVPYGETVSVKVRLVPYWVTNHKVTAVLNPAVDGVTVSVEQGTQSIAKYSTPCSIISITNESTSGEDIQTNLVVTAQDSGKVLSIPITVKAGSQAFDTTGMYAAYMYENTVETSEGSGIATLADATGNNKNPLTNFYYSGTNQNGVCRIPGKGIQSQTQGANFANSDKGFFFEQFDPNASRTVVFSIKIGKAEMRSLYYANQALFSIVPESCGTNAVSNTTEGRHGFYAKYEYTTADENGFINTVIVNNGSNDIHSSQHARVSQENDIVANQSLKNSYLHGSGTEINMVVTYDAASKSFGIYTIIDDVFVHAVYNGMLYATTDANYNNGNFVTLNTVANETILAETETTPFYWRYGNGNQKVSDFVRAICVYDKVLTKGEMLDIAARLTEHYA